MKNSTFSKLLYTAFILLLGLQVHAQNYVPFQVRYDEAIKGDMLLIGNNNLSIHKSNDYNKNTNNESSTNKGKMVYVDIDSDNTTFNSSSANLSVPSSTGCYQVVYAALYWTAVVKGDSPMEQIKFKVPGSSNYLDIVGEQVYYQNSNNDKNSNAYVYYKNVTDIISGLGNAEGTYTVGNISSATSASMMSKSKGYNQEGLSAGWSLFVIYEDPLLPSKYITSFDGFTKINNSGPVADRSQTFLVDGFQTIPVGPVRAKYAFSALEGDKNWTGDYLEINGTKIGATTNSGTTIRPKDNFFNSSVSVIDPATDTPTPFTARNPASTNTLGFDAGIISIPNAGNSVIGNGDTSATIKLGTNTDIYYFYFNAFAIEIIAPKIVLTKTVEDFSGNDIGNQLVDLGTELNYVLGFQNVGNDDAKDLIIRDVLPINIDFNYPDDIGLLPTGVSVQSYNPATRELVFKVDNSIVEIGDPLKEIRFKVTVVRECSKLNNACSNIISNQAYTTYKGTDNPNFLITDDPSFSSNTGCLLTPGATNFLADISCTFEEEVILCGTKVTLTAGDGYDSYSWSTSPTGSPVIGTGQSITVNNIGTYYVRNTATAPCQSIDQIFNVITYGENTVNPVLPFADEIVICPNDGKQLPYIFLCGANDIREIRTGITDSSSIIWEKLDEGSCAAVSNDKCANEEASCTWHEVGTGPNFDAKLAGQYRVTLHYEGGCFSQYYFNVYSNILEPTATSRDITCSTLGEIVVGGVPSGYEYSIDGVNYQSSNVFSIATAGKYNVYVKQVGVDSNPCIFSVPEIQIRERNFTGTAVVSQPLCYGDKGSVKLAANDVGPQYFYSISKDGTLINSVGPVMESDYTYANLSPGTYTATIKTEDGCEEVVTFEIVEPPLLSATAAITKPLLECAYDDPNPDPGVGEGENEDAEGDTEAVHTGGIITVTPNGGTAPYYYFVNGSDDFQSEPEILVTTPGTYSIRVVDANNCSTEIEIKIELSPAPEFTVTSADILCYGYNSGEIRFNVTNANGNAILYSIDGGVTFTSNPVFMDLVAGTYSTMIKYNVGDAECMSQEEAIVITQVDEALTASAGVSELAGCEPSGSGMGKVRITNPQGGTPPYSYSFDNQATWVSSNEAFVAPGTYTLYIKDANDCIYPMPGIVMEPEPVAPSIAVSTPDFDCDGTASAMVTVNNPESVSFSYTYLLNGVENTNTADPKTFLNVPDGNHVITVRYQLETVPTYSNLLYETFGYGEDTTSPGINTDYYCFERQVVETQCNGAPNINDGDYSVTSKILHPFSTWLQPGDHTPNPHNIPKGRALVVNIGDKIPVTAVLYEKEINDIIPNQPINVEFFAMNLIKSTSNIYDPDLLVALVDASGNEISSFSTGNIPKSEQWENYPKTPMTLDPGNNTSLKFILRSNVRQTNGNDVAIDDIKVYQLPKACITEVNFPFIVEPEKAFKAEVINAKDVTCFGADDGSITISAQNFNSTKGFQYSLDGTTWITEMASPVTITDLAAGVYNIQVRYDDADDTCSFVLDQDIKAPTQVAVTATTSPESCLVGGTIKAKATGGTPAYTYELWDAANTTLVTAFPSNGNLNNVPAGDYTIRATDANGCTATTTVSLLAVEMPEATLDTTSNLCYDAANGATIVVDASKGKAPYEYRINGGAYQSGNTFTNLTPGNYNITVRDANGCEVNLPEQIIAPQLSVSTIITEDLDCTVTPDAVITGTISGGYAPFTYAVSTDGGITYTDLGTTGTPFTYTTTVAGSYQFQITDAQGCTAVSGVSTINAITDPEFTATPTHILCFGDDNGAIKVVIDKTKGIAPFIINIKNETTGVDFGSQTTSLPAGTYTVTVTDAKSCETTETVIITQPDAIDVVYHADPITCDILSGGISKGAVVIDGVSGGTAPYNYFVTGTNGYNNSELNNMGTTSVSFNVVDFGLYQINVVDANGCSVLVQDVLVASPVDDLDIDIQTTVDCAIGGEAVVSIGTTLASAGPFHFSIYQGPGTVYPDPVGAWLPESAVGSKTATFTGLTPGVLYTFIVYDESTGCSYFETAETPIPSYSDLTASALVASNITCTGAADGMVSFEVNNPGAVAIDVSYEIFNSLSLASTGFSGIGTVPANGTLSVSDLGTLPFGNYYVLISETSGPNAGCGVVTTTFNITESAYLLNVSATVDNNANCEVNSGVISVIAKDGTAPYQYQLLPATAPAPDASDSNWGSTSTFNVDAGQYLVYAMDAYGCIQVTPAILDVIQDPIPVVFAEVTNQCDTVEGEFKIDVSLTTTGIAPYSFSINGGAFQTQSVSFTISNLTSGTHTIEVKDANGCGNMVSVTIDPPLAITPAVTGIVSCSDDDGEITVTAVGGTGNYTYAITAGPLLVPSQVSHVFTGLPAGTYEVTITDDKNCTATANITLEAPTPVDFDLEATDITCHGGTDGTITVTLEDDQDNPVYKYEIIAGPSTRPAQDSNVFEGLAAGTYTVQVTSGRNCVAVKDIEVGQPDEIQITAHTVVEYACIVDTNSTTLASITVDAVTGGSGTYTKYEFIKGGVIVQAGANPKYTETDLSGGLYTINVYDDNGCVGTTTATIQPFISIDALTVTVDNAITCTNDEDITVVVSSTGGTPANLEFVLVEHSGTIPSQTNNTGVFTALPVGNYIITVTNLDTGCTLQTVHYVNDPDTFDLEIDSVVDVTCFDALDGSVNVTFIDRLPTPTDDAGPFSYTITNALGVVVKSGSVANAGPVTISGLAAGTYTISASLTNTPFCTVDKNFTITAPTAALEVIATHTEITCFDSYNDGSILASASGGWPGGYEFALSGAATVAWSPNRLFTDLSAGTYTVSVRDSSGCIATETVILKNPDPIVFTAAADMALLSCFGDTNATITATLPTGGQGSNYTYTLNRIVNGTIASSSGPQSSPVFSGLGAGTYSVTVIDGYNCDATSVDIVIVQPDPVAADLVATTTATCDFEATLTLSATGGTGMYEYSTSSTFATIAGTFAASTTFSVAPGTYKYYVRDANGCLAVVTNDIKVDPVPDLSIALTGTNVHINCYGDNNGAIVAKAQGGLGNYVYTLLDASQTPIAGVVPNNTGIFNDLLAGVYYVSVVSGDCDEISDRIEITQPDAPLDVDYAAIDISCFGGADGMIEITATGGTGQIKYAISPQLNQFFESNVFEDLAPGTYQIIVQDEVGCYEIIDVTITQPDPVLVSIVPGSIVPEICYEDENGEFSIAISGGTLPYSVSLDDYDGPYTTGAVGQTQFDFTGLTGGDHTVFVRDSNGCESEWNITIPESVRIDPIAEVDYLCDDNLPGNRVTVTVHESNDGNLSEFDYSLNGGPFQSSNVFENVVAGIGHYITVRHTNGCEITTALFDIDHVEVLQLGIDDGEMNQIVAVATGGTGDYTYTLNGQDYGSTSTFIITQSGDYTVTVTDSSGCVATATRYFEFIDICIPNYFTPNGDNVQDTWAPGCANNYPNLEFRIFDRYGREVGTYRQGQAWDGKYNGRELPTGDYWYIVKLNDANDDRDFVGHFTLYR